MLYICLLSGSKSRSVNGDNDFSLGLVIEKTPHSFSFSKNKYKEKTSFQLHFTVIGNIALTIL